MFYLCVLFRTVLFLLITTFHVIRLLLLGIQMNIQTFAVQTVLGLLRHLMTASPFLAALVSESQLVQVATVVVGGGGFLWSAYRKWKAAK